MQCVSKTQTGTRTESEPDAETDSDADGSGRRPGSTVTPYLWRGVRSGVATGIIGGIGVLRGLRSVLGGQRDRGFGELALGGVFLAAAYAQRQSRRESVEESDVVDTGPDIEGITDEAGGGVDQGDHATGQAAGGLVDSTPDVPSDGTAAREDTGSSETVHPEAVDRLGEAAVDSQSREVPVPQRAFNQGFLAHSAEAFWGIRGRDDAVLVSQDFDAVQGRDGVKYVASSEIGEDARELPIPTAVLTHWDEVGGGGTAVAGGDGVLFVTTDSLEADHLLRVLPSAWPDDLPE